MSGHGGLRREVTSDELDAPLLDYDEAMRRVADAFTPLPPQRAPLSDALGLVLAEQVVATDDIPSFENSAMDGYAVRSADLHEPTTQLVIRDEPGAGAAVKVMTGQPIPDGADAVVPWERTRQLGSDRVRDRRRGRARPIRPVPRRGCARGRPGAGSRDGARPGRARDGRSAGSCRAAGAPAATCRGALHRR